MENISKEGQIDCKIIKKNAGIERLKRDCLEAQKKYDECWEDQPFDENDEKFTCTRCGGMLYIEQGGEVVDCTSCGGTGVQKPERIFNAQKFGEWIETNPFFYFDENEEDYKDNDSESIFSL